MTTNPRENKKYIGIIVDRNGPDNSMKVFLPEIHGKDVSIDDLGWSRFTVPPGGSSATTNFGTPDNGQMVTCIVNTTGGSTLVEVTGLYQTKQAESPSNPSNLSLNLVLPQWSTAINTPSAIRVPPSSIQETTVDGAKVRQPVERNQQHMHSLLNSIISHAAAFPLNGTILPNVTVGTAVQPSMSSMSTTMQSLLGGTSTPSLGSILGSFLASAAAAALPPQIAAAMTSTVNLMTSVETTPSDGAYVPNAKSNTQALLHSANSMLSNVSTSGDIHTVFSQLTSNTSLHKRDSIANTSISTSGTFGDTTITLNPLTGQVTITPSNTASAAMAAFSSLLGSIPGANGTDIFSGASATIAAMGERLANTSAKSTFKERIELNTAPATGTDPRKRVDQDGVDTPAGFIESAIQFITG